MYFLPFITPMIVIAMVWQWIFDPNIGLFANLFNIHLKWLYDTNLAMPALIIVSVWKLIGYNTVLFLTGFATIPNNIFEAAKIDSANNWQILWKIIIPIIKPIALVCTIFTIAQLGTYDTNPVYGLIKTATGNLAGGLGYAATYAWIYSFLVLLIIGAAFLIFRDKKEKKGGI